MVEKKSIFFSWNRSRTQIVTFSSGQKGCDYFRYKIIWKDQMTRRWPTSRDVFPQTVKIEEKILDTPLSIENIPKNTVIYIFFAFKNKVWEGIFKIASVPKPSSYIKNKMNKFLSFGSPNTVMNILGKILTENTPQIAQRWVSWKLALFLVEMAPRT